MLEFTKINGDLVFIIYRQITAIEPMRTGTMIYTTDQREFHIKETIKEVFTKFPRSYL